MTDTKFISPTMDWLYARDPEWVSDVEALYKLGFSRSSKRDVHGYDVFGFNETGRDRLGCSENDYADPEIMEIGRATGESMSLSQKLPVALPHFLKLKPVFEQVCPGLFDIEEQWTRGFDQLPEDGLKRFFTDIGHDFAIGLHWFDLDDRTETYLMVRTDVIARMDADDIEREIPFRIVSKAAGSNYEYAENVVVARSAESAAQVIADHVSEFLRDERTWNVRIVDGEDGPELAALSNAELADAVGDAFGPPVIATSKEWALQSIMDDARTSGLASMASRGILRLTGNPVAGLGPRG